MQNNLNIQSELSQNQTPLVSADVSAAVGAGIKSDEQMSDVSQTEQMEKLIDQIILGAKEINLKIQSKFEPVELILQINQQLQDHHVAIWEFISQQENAAKKKEFYEKVFKFVANNMLNEKMLSNQEYLPQILRFFRNVLVNFFPNDIEDENLAEVVHSIFNLDAYLYTQALQQSRQRMIGGQNDNGDGAESLDTQRVNKEFEWRAQLKIGERVDAIKIKHQQQYRVQGWSRGEITKFLNDNHDSFLIQFDNEPPSMNAIINRYGNQLAPEGTFTDDIDWRQELQPGQEIDCLDSENIWYRSTVLDQREVVNDGRVIKQLHVGFRVYDEEEGHKNDDDGRKFVGWSNKYDEWRTISCVTVQKLRTMVKQYKQAGRSFMIYDCSVDDICDVMQNTHNRKIWAVYRPNFFANLRCIADYLNEFGIRGGFNRILHFFSIVDDTRKVSLKHIQYLLDFLSKSQSLWHRQFAIEFVPVFKIVFERLLLFTNSQNNGPMQLQFQKETLQNCFRASQAIFKRYYTIEQTGILQSDMQFSLGFALLNSDKLEKRIQGIKEIAEQIKNSKFQMKKMMSTQEILNKMQQENFCQKIFGDNYHIQIIQRSSEILKFLIQEKKFGPQEIELMWQATKKDQQTKIEIYKIISETGSNYRSEEQELWIDKFSTIEPSEFLEREIECVYDFVKFIYKQSPQSLKASKLFWEIATRQKPYKKQLIDLAIDKFLDVTRNWEREDKGHHIFDCIVNIKDHNLQSSLQSIKILSKILDNIPTFKQNNNPTRLETASQLVDTFKLFDLIAEDIICYEKVVNDLWSKNIINKDNVDQIEILDLPFTHRHQLYFRLNFFRQCIGQGVMGNVVPQSSTRVEFKIHVHPNELEGIDVIWRMLEDVDKKNGDLLTHIINLISKVYLNLSQLIEDKIHEIGESFTQECLRRFINISQSQTISFEEKSQLAKYLVVMMKSFFEDSEKNGTGSLKPHLAIDKGEFIGKIVITNNITSVKSCPKYIEVNTYSNMTLWELKKIIGSKTKTSALKVQLNRSDTKKKQLTDGDNIKLLRELKIENNETLTAQKKQSQFIPKVPLINKRKELVPEAKKIFESWFELFSTEDGFMTQDTCVEFIKNSTGDPNVNTADSRVQKLFEEFDVDRDGKLSRIEFLEFYRERSINKSELVWSNLSVHHFGPDLRPVNYNQFSEDDPFELKDKTLLARFKLSNDLNQFNILFELLDKGFEEVWTLINNLRTNPHIYTLVLAQDQLTFQNLENENIYKQLYILQIIEQFMNNYQIKKHQEVKSYYLESNIENISGYPSLPNENVAPQSGHNSNNHKSNDKTGDVGGLSGNDNKNNNQSDNKGASTQQNNNVNVNKSDNIPDAPPIGYGPLPPPNMQNTQVQVQRDKIFDTLDAFTGAITIEEIQNDVFTQEEMQFAFGINGSQDFEVVKQEWLPKFLNQGGLDLLISILKNILEQCSHKKQEDVLKSKYEKELVNTLVRVIKIITMSTFCANSPNQELSMQLSRKISTVIEEDQVSPNKVQDDQKQEETKQQLPQQENQQQQQLDQQVQQKQIQLSKIQLEQEETAKAYQPLITLLMGEVGQHIFRNLNFQQFQELIIKVILMILNKQIINFEDRAIIDQAIGLWISLIVFNPDLFVQIQRPLQTENDIEKNMNEGQSIAVDLLEKGLVNGSFQVRNALRDAFLFICKSVKSVSNSEIPQFYFLRLQLNYFDKIVNTQNSGQFFELLKGLMLMYFEAKAQAPMIFQEVFDPQVLIKDIINKLHNYISNEKKGAYSDDPNLSGMIQIINMLILHNNNVLSFQENELLIKEIIESLLFSFNLQPLNQHITKEVQLGVFEKPYLNKCQSQQSRQAAYTLLNTICQQYPQLVGDLISQYWEPLISHIKKPKKQGFAPRSDGRASNGYCGIKNLGCICYMNSMIQQFFNVPAFRYGVMAADDRSAVKFKEFEGDQVDDSLLHQLIKYMSFLELTERQDYNPREFCFAFKDFDGLPTNVRIQQDAQEFLNVVFDRIEYQLKGTSQKYLLQNIFGGKTCSLMICKSCGNLRQRQEDFYNITVEVKNQKTVYEGLKKFTTGEIINDFQCEACNQKVDIERKTVVEKLPNMLILHLQRIVYDFDSLQNLKLNSKVEFPNVLNMKPYMLSEVMKQEKDILKKAKKDKKLLEKQQSQNSQNESLQKQNKMEDEKEEEDQNKDKSPEKQINQDNNNISSDDEAEEDQQMKDQEASKEPEVENDENFEYKLVGVVLHMGTADAGHYLSFININRGSKPESSPEWLKTDKDKWLEFNDSTVKDYKFSELEDDCFGGVQNVMGSSGDFKNDYSRNAYMLVYEKRVKEKIKVVVPQDLLQQQQNNQQLSQSQLSLDCDGTAISRVQQIDMNTSVPHLLYICPQLLEQVREGRDIYFDQENQETIALVDFNSMQKFVPNQYYKMVHDDNSLFLYERHIFNNTFFECTKNLLDLVIQRVPDLLLLQPYSDKLFKFIEKLIFDIVAMTSENKYLLQLTDLMINMLKQNDDYTLKFIEERIMDFNLPQEVIITGEKKEEKKEEKKIRGIFDLLCTNMERDVREMSCMLLTFSVLKLFELGKYEQIETIIDYAFTLIPEEVSKNWLKMSNYFQFLYNIVNAGPIQMTYLINKGIVTKFIDFFMENESPKAQGMQKRNMMGSNYAQPPFDFLITTICTIGRYMPRLYNPLQLDQSLDYYEQIRELNSMNPPSPFYCNLIKDFSVILNPDDVYMLQQKKFYVKAVRLNLQVTNISQLLAHVTYENYDFSRSIAKKLLLAINQCNGDDIQPYLTVLAPFLFNPDSYTQSRLEWILGVPILRIEKPSSSFNMMPASGCNYKAGFAIQTSMNDDIYEYRSTLFKSSTGVKESLLQILYQYRKRWTMYTLYAIQMLINVTVNDPQRRIIKYLITLEPPSYSYARYIDWIKPYLEDTIMSASRMPNANASKMEIQLGNMVRIQLNQLLETLKQEQIPKLQQDQSVQMQQEQQNEQQIHSEQKILEHDSLKDGGPEQYIILNIQQERQIEVRSIPEHNITVYVYEYQTLISESKPTGNGNLVLNNFKKNQNNMNNNRNNNNNGGGLRGNSNNNNSNYTINHPYGRGKAFDGYQASQFSSTGKKRGRKPMGGMDRQGGAKKVKGKKVISANPQQEQDIRDTLGFVNEDGSVNIQGETNIQGGAVSDVPMADDETYTHNSANNVNDGGEEGEYEDDDIEGYENTNEDTSNSFNNNQQRFKDDTTGYPVGNQMADQDYEQPYSGFNNQPQNFNSVNQDGVVSSAVVNPHQQQPLENQNQEADFWQTLNPTIIVFNVVNNDVMRTQKVVIRFQDLSQSDNGGQKPNFKIPVTPIPCQVNSNREKDAFIMTKLRPFEEWGAFSYDITVEQQRAKNSGFVGVPVGNQDAIYSGGAANVQVGMDIVPVGNFDEIPCQACTFSNPKYLSNCEICGGKL